MFCSECGAENKLGSKFCTACGKPLNISSNSENGLIARILAQKEKDKNIVKGVTKTTYILKILCAFLFVVGSIFVLVSFYFSTIPFIICCIVCYCICIGLITANGILTKNSKNSKTKN